MSTLELRNRIHFLADNISDNTRLKEAVKALLGSDSLTNDWADDISDDVKKAISEAKIEVKNGEVKSHKEVMKKYSEWL